MLWFRKIRLRKYVPRMLPPLKGNQSHRMMPPGRWSLPPALQIRPTYKASKASKASAVVV